MFAVAQTLQMQPCDCNRGSSEASFVESNFLDMPLEKKNKRGAKKKSKSALLRQSIETVREIPRLIEASSDESTSEDEDLEPIAPIVVAKKRGRPPSGAVQSKKFKK